MGGLSKQIWGPTILAFTGPGVCLYVYNLSIRIAANTPGIVNIPPLLGRDMTDRWALTYDKINAGLTAEVVQSDMRFLLGAKPSE